MASHRVLLVEDSEFMSQQVSDGLESAGYETETARSATAARDVLDASDVDCVLVNHDLPDETGLEFAESLNETVPVILLTTTELNEIATEAVEAGITEFVHKDDLVTGSMTVLTNRVDVVIRATLLG